MTTSRSDIRLSPAEMMLASSVGCMRHIAAVKAGRSDKHGAQAGGWQLHIEGALGEMALAKAIGIYWSGSINSFSAPDLGRSVQVRTRSRHDYELIVREHDDNNHKFALVTGCAPDYIVHGWILGKHAKKHEWIREYGGREAAYFVPQSNLLPIAALSL